MPLLDNFLYRLPEWLILLALLGLLLLGVEGGYPLARRRRLPASDLVRGQFNSIQGALLGLFALLIGFTFAMSLSRFDVRKNLVVKEANAVGTAVLRARLLPAAGSRPHHPAVAPGARGPVDRMRGHEVKRGSARPSR